MKKSSLSKNVRTRWDRVRRTVVLADAPEKALTQQQFKDECDMNRIVRNAARGIAPRYYAQGQPHYGDFTNVVDLTEAYNVVARAEEAFMTLPAKLRAELGNDPARINEITRDQAARHGLLNDAPASQTSNGAPNPSTSSSAPSAPGQGAMAGTEPASSAPKGGPKQSSKTTE